MTQGMFLFKYEEEKIQIGMTALAGLPVYMDLANLIGKLSNQVQMQTIYDFQGFGLY